MKPEKQQLIHDLLDDENRREIILAAGGQILRRRRRWRSIRLSLTLLLLTTGAGLWLVEKNPVRTSFQSAAVPTTRPSAPIQVRFLTDDELLSLFPNTPVGLICA